MNFFNTTANTTVRTIPCLLLFCVTYAHSNETPEIIVTADLRQSTTMETSSSLTIVSEQVIEARSAQHFEDILNVIPNVNFAAGSNRARFFQIRGIGERSQFVNPINPSVGVLIDDVDFSGAGTIATLMDVKQVEVLRGPQGTRYGANALAGLINFSTNEPGEALHSSVKLSAGEYGTQTAGVVLNVPISETLLSRFVVESHESDGYVDNDFLGSDTTNDRDELTARAKFSWQVKENWSLGLSLAAIDIDNGYDAFSLDNNRHTLSDEPGFDRQDSTYASLKSSWILEAMAIELLWNQSDSDLDYGYDEDWSFTGIHPWGYTSTDYYLRERATSSAEIRLLSNDSSRIFSDTTDWVVGLYYLSSNEELQRQYTFLPADFLSDYDFDTLAMFSQLDVALSGRMTLSVGLRVEQRDTEYNDSEGVTFSPDDSFRGGKIALEYLIGDNTLTYGSVARGYKAGGFNIDGSLDADLRSFDEEYLIEYELGVKTRLANERVALQLALFFDDRHNQQIKSSLVRARPDGSTEFIDYIGNAAAGTNRGVEVDVNWTVSNNLNVNANAGWLDAEFDEFINEFGEDLSGRDQAHAPAYTYSLNVSYGKGPWFARVSADGKDDFFFSDRHSVKSKRYTLYNASIGFESEQWKVTLWGRNLTDKDYYVRGFGSFGNDPRNFYVTEPYFQYGEPRVTGVTLLLTLGG
ncbi:MAG: TonB-dependent receptor [Candidatus Azotimanducaceae bacterium WSBS_2022_MAG_OTU7]